jgi:hypothetical protein
MAGPPGNPSKKKSIFSGFRSASTAVYSLVRKSRKSRKKTPPQSQPSNNNKPPTHPPRSSKPKSKTAAVGPHTSNNISKKKKAPTPPTPPPHSSRPQRPRLPTSVTPRRPLTPTSPLPPSKIKVEHCKIPKNMKKGRQHMLEKLLFTGDRSFKADVEELDLKGGNIKIVITNNEDPEEQYILQNTRKKLGEGGYGSVFLLNEVSTKKEPVPEPVSIVIKCMKGIEEVQISEDLRKVDCDILRLSFIKHDGKVEKINGYYLAFMDTASGDLNKKKEKTLLSRDEQLNIGNQVLKQLTCLYNLRQVDRYLYTDLKPANVLYYCEDETPIKVQLADLGSAVPRKSSSWNCISTYPAPEYRGPEYKISPHRQGFFKANIGYRAECGRILSYQLGFLIIALVKKPEDLRNFEFNSVFDKEEHTNLEAKAEKILPGLSHFIKEDPKKRINILDRKYKDKTFGDILKEASKK